MQKGVDTVLGMGKRIIENIGSQVGKKIENKILGAQIFR